MTTKIQPNLNLDDWKVAHLFCGIEVSSTPPNQYKKLLPLFEGIYVLHAKAHLIGRRISEEYEIKLSRSILNRVFDIYNELQEQGKDFSIEILELLKRIERMLFAVEHTLQKISHQLDAEEWWNVVQDYLQAVNNLFPYSIPFIKHILSERFNI